MVVLVLGIDTGNHQHASASRDCFGTCHRLVWGHWEGRGAVAGSKTITRCWRMLMIASINTESASHLPLALLFLDISVKGSLIQYTRCDATKNSSYHARSFPEASDKTITLYYFYELCTLIYIYAWNALSVVIPSTLCTMHKAIVHNVLGITTLRAFHAYI
jgi:hypothetical protein